MKVRMGCEALFGPESQDHLEDHDYVLDGIDVKALCNKGVGKLLNAGIGY